ncbi:STAS/SEC14 domain-containing protein [Anabaena catenula]|uniref:STAS/SEC14 domain-containing protein n=1 Tax=Anabaena catenula FACHB-362 TaxID=2692877 RepID=A0ABR8IYV0_9NOST|nr:STAS/SEC14 domain-containing protein [Anabaena catenula]MBD2690562.1 STAS/SEC14 domain-containing protein [Anabaena catenula FACHB-362]
MSTVKLEVQLSLQHLVKAVEQLKQPDLEKFVSQIIILHAHKKADNLLKNEGELLLQTHQDIPSTFLNYHNKLIAKREEERLTDEEYRELLHLSEQIDKLQAHRLEYLANLALLHGITLTELVQNLGFGT